MLESFRVPSVVCLVLLGWTATAGAAPNAAPHDQLIPSDNASHACPALEAKWEEAKSPAQAEHFANQLWAHGCRTCEDAVDDFAELLESGATLYAAPFASAASAPAAAAAAAPAAPPKGKSAPAAPASLLPATSSLSEAIRAVPADYARYASEGAYDVVIVGDSANGFKAFAAPSKDSYAFNLIAEIATYECDTEIIVKGELAVAVIGCSQAIGDRPLLIDPSCSTIEEQIRKSKGP